MKLIIPAYLPQPNEINLPLTTETNNPLENNFSFTELMAILLTK